MGPSLVAAILTLTLVAAVPAASASAAVIHSTPSDRVDVRLFDLAAVRRLFFVIARRGAAMSEGERAGALADFSLMTNAVTGGTPAGPFTFDELARAATSGEGPHVLATQGVGMRDEVAYQLLALGYSARETADVVSGRITQQALDMAQRMIAVGQAREAAADYLDSQYKLIVALQKAQRVPSRGKGRVSSSAFDSLIEQYANLHQVEAAIVRAIMQTESGFNPAARSPVGAIGLMQLMPSTARELGVNPFVPEQNIEGGVRYFSQLLRMFGGVELALVAYNAGPGFAQRYARGQAVLYGETREYVRKVLERFNSQR